MQFLIVLEALKIHKVKFEKAVQRWFIFLYAINLLPFVLPVGDRDFSRILQAADNMMSGQMPEQPAWQLLSSGNLVILTLMILAGLVTIFFGFMYACLIVAERYKEDPVKAFQRSLSAIPKIIAFVLLLIIPAIFSAFAAFLPLLIFLLMMYMLPMYLAWSQKGLFDAMRHSYEATRGHKLQLFFQLLFLSLIISLPQNIILSFTAQGGIAYILIASFFTVFRALVFGRLMGLLYFFLVKKEEIVIPSRPNKNE